MLTKILRNLIRCNSMYGTQWIKIPLVYVRNTVDQNSACYIGAKFLINRRQKSYLNISYTYFTSKPGKISLINLYEDILLCSKMKRFLILFYIFKGWSLWSDVIDFLRFVYKTMIVWFRMKVRTAERRVTLTWIPRLLLCTFPSTLSSTRLSETMTMLVQVPVSLSMLA